MYVLRCLSWTFRAVIGELDEDLDSEINLEDIKAEPLNAIVH